MSQVLTLECSYILADKLGKHALDVKFLMWLVLCSQCTVLHGSLIKRW